MSADREQVEQSRIAAIRAAALSQGLARFPADTWSGTPWSQSPVPDRYQWPDPTQPSLMVLWRQIRRTDTA